MTEVCTFCGKEIDGWFSVIRMVSHLSTNHRATPGYRFVIVKVNGEKITLHGDQPHKYIDGDEKLGENVRVRYDSHDIIEADSNPVSPPGVSGGPSKPVHSAVAIDTTGKSVARTHNVDDSDDVIMVKFEELQTDNPIKEVGLSSQDNDRVGLIPLYHEIGEYEGLDIRDEPVYTNGSDLLVSIKHDDPVFMQ